jgi:hypothetical protein
MTIRAALTPILERSAFELAALATALLVAPGRLHAQAANGKLEGLVWDASGTPLADAQVIISGTAFFALTNPRGYYFINNIPPGTVSVRVVHLGHRPLEVGGLRVLAGQTVTQDYTLERAPYELVEIAVVAADNALVPRDEVTTKQRIDGEFVRELPVDGLLEVLQLQPGVAAYTGSVRGGRANETVTYLDGVPVSPVQRELGIAFPPNAVQEASLTTGATSAEFGNAMSGVVSIQTRSGGSRYSGSVSYETDEVFGSSHGWGLNRIEGSFGGPIARNLTFFLSGLVDGRQSPGGGRGIEQAPMFVSAGIDTTVTVPTEPGNPVSDSVGIIIPRFAVARGRCDEFATSANEGIRTNYGRPCGGVRTPYSPSTGLSLQGKLSYTYGSGSRLTLSYFGRRNRWRETFYENFYNLPESFGLKDRNDVATLEWTQNLARTSERALALQTYLSYQRDRFARSTLTPDSEQASRDPFGGLLLGSFDLLYDFDNFPLTEELVHDIDGEDPDAQVTPYDRETAARLETFDSYRNNAYAVPGWNDGGGPSGTLGLWLESRYVGRSVLDWQVDRHNRLRLGGELIRYTMGRYDDCCPVSAYLERPVYWDLFVEDRLDLGDVVLVGGLRLDGYRTGAFRDYVLDTVPGNPRFGEYVEHIYELPFGAEERSFQGRPLLISRRDPSHAYLSPHVQVAFPVTDRTNVRLSYAHQVQAPDFRFILGASDLDFGQTVAYEFGVRHAWSENVVFDVALYNKDNRASPAERKVTRHHPLTGILGTYSYLTNADFGNTRGVELRLDGRIGSVVNGMLGYTYQSARSTASDPFENASRAARSSDLIAGFLDPPPQAILPVRFSRPHSLAGAVSLTVPPGWRRGTLAGALFGDLSLYATLLYTSGTAYTPCPDVAGNEGTLSFFPCPQIGPIQRRGAVNSVRLPSLRQFDLRITKTFEIGRFRLIPYLDARNLLDFTNVNAVFAVTGTTTDDAHRRNVWTADSSAYADEAGASGVRMDDGSMDLRFEGAVASGCAAWVRADGLPAPPNCVYLIRAEERYGDGDHVFTLDEQRRASEALYHVGNGRHAFVGEPRRLRIGLEVTF